MRARCRRGVRVVERETVAHAGMAAFISGRGGCGLAILSALLLSTAAGGGVAGRTRLHAAGPVAGDSLGAVVDSAGALRTSICDVGERANRMERSGDESG